MIKAVIFDYGNVISVAQTGDCADEMQAMTGGRVSAEVFRSVYDKFRFDFDRGLITGQKMYEILLRDAGFPDLADDSGLTRKIALLDMQSWREFRQDVTEWGLSLKAQGYRLGILSNMPTEFLQYYGGEIPLFSAADYACFSCNVRMIKPEPGIYADCIRGLGVLPEEAVFFDDVQENVDAGNAFGIRSFLWQGLEQAKRDWARAVGREPSA